MHQQKIKLRWNAIKIISLIFILILLLTSFLGIDPMASLVGKEPYFQGWVIYGYLWFFSVMVSTTRIEPKKWIMALSMSSVIVSLVVMRQAGSTFGQPNFYSGFLLLILPFVPRKGWWLLVIGLNMMAIFVSESRIAMIILLLILVWWFLDKLKNYSKKIIVPLSIIILLLVGFILYSIGQITWKKEGVMPFESQWLIDNSPEKRIYIWPIMEKLAQEKFFLGYGLDNIGMAYEGFFQKINWNSNKIPVYYSLKDLNVDRSHNSLLDILLFSGIIGLVVYAGLVGAMLRKIKNKIIFASLLIYLVWTQFQNQSIVHLMYFWLLVGLIDKDDT